MATAANLPAAFFMLLICCIGAMGETQNKPSIKAKLEQVLQNYDKHMAPNFGASEPLQIDISMYIIDVSSVNENTMDFSVTFYFRQFWKDNRLSGMTIEGWDGRIIQDSDFINRIWTPDTFFPKDKETILHDTAHPNSFLKISPEGDVMRSIRVTSKTSCSMDLTNFPMDLQTCSLEIESYGYMASEVHYKWKTRAVGVFQGLELMRFELVGYRSTSDYLLLSMGNYSRVGVEFFFRRDRGYYVMILYLPSALIVLLSCLSFWLSPHCILARGALTLTCVLANAILLAGNDDALPPVSYVRAIDIYIIVCFILVLYALAQFVIVYHLRPRNCQPQYEEMEKQNNLNDEQQRTSFQLDASLLKIMESRATTADRYAKYFVPVIFFLFNFFYWIVYLSIGGISGEYTKYPPE